MWQLFLVLNTFQDFFLFRALATLYLIKKREQNRAVCIFNSQEVKPRKG